mmetsp:Transcript_58909/g.140595  ORF Transcript_58909/g.140595 Transcript_58909/m.140595 type:complete len:264 (+) Transcript_58909:309-1100(+)
MAFVGEQVDEVELIHPVQLLQNWELSAFYVHLDHDVIFRLKVRGQPVGHVHCEDIGMHATCVVTILTVIWDGSPCNGIAWINCSEVHVAVVIAHGRGNEGEATPSGRRCQRSASNGEARFHQVCAVEERIRPDLCKLRREDADHAVPQCISIVQSRTAILRGKNPQMRQGARWRNCQVRLWPNTIQEMHETLHIGLNEWIRLEGVNLPRACCVCTGHQIEKESQGVCPVGAHVDVDAATEIPHRNRAASISCHRRGHRRSGEG